MNRYETSSRCWRSVSRLRIAAWTDTSSAEVGSSQTTIRGSPANARAIATRCLSPPDSCAGRIERWRSDSRTSAISFFSLCVSASPCVAPESRQRPRDEPLDRMPAVQRRVRVLEDDLERLLLLVRPARGSLGERLAVERDLRALVGSSQAEQRPRERGLAASGLADQPERLAGAELHGDVDEPVDRLSFHVEGLGRPQRRGSAARPRSERSPGAASRSGGITRGERLRSLVEVAPRTATRAAVRPRTAEAPPCGNGLRRDRNGRRRCSRRVLTPDEGKEPGIVSSDRCALSVSRRGMHRSSPTVYGWRGSVEHARALAPPRPARRRRARRRGRTSSRSRRGCG